MTAKEIKDPPSISMRFPKGGKVQPGGFKELGVDEEVTVILKGKVKRLEHDSEEWNPGKHVTIQPTSCEFQKPAREVTLDDALKASRVKAG